MPTHVACASSVIPSSLFEIYLNYKKDTRAIVAWLISHEASSKSKPSSLSVRDLLDLAHKIRAKAVRMPDAIHWHFRQAINARTYLTTFFKHDDIDQAQQRSTVDHEFFTAR
jgi:hypothetical protein